MKTSSLISAVAALLSLVGSTFAGTLTITSDLTFTPPESFTNNTLTAEVISNPPGVTGDLVRISGGSTIVPPSINPAEADLSGSFSAVFNDKVSVAYSFTVDSASVNPVTYTIGGSITIPPLPPQDFSDSGTIDPGLHEYSNVIDTGVSFPFGVSGTFTGSLALDFTGGGAPVGDLDIEVQQIDIQLAQETATLPPPAQSLNISTRGDVQTGEDVLIGGFIITGESPKQVIIRALGPSLALSQVSGFLADPVLTLYDSNNTVITSNDNWKDNSAADQMIITDNMLDQYQGATINDDESIVVQTLDPGAYTAIVSGVADGTGVALVEVYDIDSADGQLANISTRGFISTDQNVLIGGFILGPETDGAPQIVVRAIGPSLVDKGVTNAIADPILSVMDANANVIAANDNWADDENATTITDDGLAPTGTNSNFESAVLIIPQPGEYTAIVSGVTATTTGVGLVEVYNLQ